MGGSPQTFSQGGNPAPYVPQAQPTADTGFQNIANSFYNAYTSGQSPGQQYYPQVQSAVGSVVNNPYAQGALNTAQQIPQLGATLGGGDLAQGAQLSQTAQQGLPFVQQALGNAFSPGYDQIANQVCIHESGCSNGPGAGS